MDVVEKAFAWLDAGVRLVWVVDPANRLVTVYSSAGTATLRGSATLDGAAVLPGFSLSLDDLWV